MNKFRVLAIATAFALPLSVLAQTTPAPTPGMSTTPAADGHMHSKDKMKKQKKGDTTPAPAPDATKAPAAK